MDRSCITRRQTPGAVPRRCFSLAATLMGSLVAPPLLLGLGTAARAADNQAQECPPLPSVAGPLQQWDTIASMPTPRTRLAATAGCDGRVYALGGQAIGAGATGTPTGTTTPSPTGTGSPTGTPTGPTVTPAAQGSPTMPGSPTSPATETATPTPTSPPPGAAAAPVGAVNIYDPAANNWTSGPDLPTPRSNLAAATDSDGAVYAIGGRTGDSNKATDIVEVYSPSDGSWSAGPSLPSPMGAPAAARGTDGLIYVVDGKTMAVFDPEKDSWSTAAGPPSATMAPVVTALPDGRILAVGGTRGGGGSPPAVSTDVFAYTPGANTPEQGSWAQMADLPTGVAQAAGSTGPDGRVYIIGGREGGGAVSDAVQVYTPDKDSWADGPSGAPSTRAGHAAATGGDGMVFVVGGVSGDQEPAPAAALGE